MDNIRSYLSRQTTSVLQAALPQKQEHIDMIKDILCFRSYLLEKYAHDKLMCMDADALVDLLNHPELRSEDQLASRSIMADILDILEAKYPDADIRFEPELIVYLTSFNF